MKLPLYALAGITEYWIVDLQARILDRYWRPEAGAYAEHVPHGPHDRIALFADPEIIVALDLVFG